MGGEERGGTGRGGTGRGCGSENRDHTSVSVSTLNIFSKLSKKSWESEEIT